MRGPPVFSAGSIITPINYFAFFSTEAAEDIAGAMASSRNVVYLPQGQQTLLALPNQ